LIEAQTSDVEEFISPDAQNHDSQNLQSNSEESESRSTHRESDKEINFKAMREQMKAMESEKQRIIAERDEYKSAFFSHVKPKAPEPQEEVDELADVGDDDWMTKKQARALAERQARAIVKESLKSYEEQRTRDQLPDRLKKEFADFDEVVTKENIEYLRANKPHIAASLASTNDPYAKAASAYEFIKLFCPTVNKPTEDQMKADKNSKKPGTLSSPSAVSPLSQAKMFETGRLSPEMKAQLQKEMIAAIRG